MKKFLIVLALALVSQFVYAQGRVTKQVCVEIKKDGQAVVDPKTGKTKQSCRQIKQHKKLEGTKVPVRK